MTEVTARGKGKLCFSAARIEYFEYVHRRGVFSKRRAQLHALYQVAHMREHLASDGNALRARCIRSAHVRHASKDRIWNRDAQLIFHELGIAQARQRPYPRKHRDTAMLDPLQEVFQQLNVEDRLRYRVLRS